MYLSATSTIKILALIFWARFPCLLFFSAFPHLPVRSLPPISPCAPGAMTPRIVSEIRCGAPSKIHCVESSRQHPGLPGQLRLGQAKPSSDPIRPSPLHFLCQPNYPIVSYRVTLLRSLYPDWSPPPELNPGHHAELGLVYGSLPSDHQPRCFVIAISLQATHNVAAIRSKQKAARKKPGNPANH